MHCSLALVLIGMRAEEHLKSESNEEEQTSLPIQGASVYTRKKKKIPNLEGVFRGPSVNASRQEKIDAICSSKNTRDDVMSSLIPRLLDLSMIDWERQNPIVKKKLREALNEEF